MKTLLKLPFFLPAMALAQTVSVPVMGTEPARSSAPEPSAQVQAPTAVPAVKNVKKRSPAPGAKKTLPEILPPPSQVTKDFYEAFSRGNLPLADMLIQQGADINCRNCGNRTPLMMKIALGDRDAVRWIIARGADVNLVGPTIYGPMLPLTAAANAMSWNKELLLDLLEAGADSNKADGEGNTPFLAWAGRDFVADYKIEGVSMMLGHGASINQPNKMGQTALMRAIESRYDCAQPVVQFLLRRGAEAAAKTVDGKTAASVAYQQALKGNTACNQVMLILRSPPQPEADATMPAGGYPPSSASIAITPGQWQGVFNTVSPRNATAGATATVSRNGDVVFSSTSGLRGTGRLNVTGSVVDGTLASKSPLDANGRPLVTNPDGSSDIVFRLNGTLSNGIIRGNYSSTIESGTFVMCDPSTYQQTPACKVTQASAGDLIQAVGGLIGAFKGLTNATR